LLLLIPVVMKNNQFVSTISQRWLLLLILKGGSVPISDKELFNSKIPEIRNLMNISQSYDPTLSQIRCNVDDWKILIKNCIESNVFLNVPGDKSHSIHPTPDTSLHWQFKNLSKLL
jgi:hypothetical protein